MGVSKIVYVTEQGCVIRRSGERILLTRDREVLQAMPIAGISNLVVFGQAQLTTQAIHLLLDSGVEVAFLTRSGRLKGVLSAGLAKNALVRLAQYRRSTDSTYRLRLARSVVRGKLKNQRALIVRYRRRTEPDDDRKALESVAATLKGLTDRVDQAETLGALMGLEGTGTRAYFSVFGRLLRGEMSWTSRSRRPPRDPPNALLSLGYVLLTNEAISVVAALSLDPYVGFLHSLRYGRASLGLDLVEEFRHGLVDALTLTLLSQRRLRAVDFEPTPEGGVVLSHDALRRYLAYYEQRMHEAVAGTRPPVAWRGLVRRQAETLREAILHGSDYEPFVLS